MNLNWDWSSFSACKSLYYNILIFDHHLSSIKATEPNNLISRLQLVYRNLCTETFLCYQCARSLQMKSSIPWRPTVWPHTCLRTPATQRMLTTIEYGSAEKFLKYLISWNVWVHVFLLEQVLTSLSISQRRCFTSTHDPLLVPVGADLERKTDLTILESFL